MKIAVLSDLHLGYAYGLETENDSYDNTEEAMQKAVESDLIILAGDIFNTRVPKTQTWAKALKILTKPLLKENSGVRLVSCTKNLRPISYRTLKHVPLIAIHGTHERRGGGEINAVQALEHAGVLVHLHCNTIVFEKNGRQIAIHAMSGVPERFAQDILDHWKPEPLPNCFNILVLHQSIEPYVYSPLDPPTIDLSSLPEGFDLIIDGHLHTHNQTKIADTDFIIPGSTVITQLEKNEAEVEKGFYEIEINGETKINFRFLENNRKFFYEELELGKGLTIKQQVETKLNQILAGQFIKQPIIKLRILGKESNVLNQDLKELERKYADRAIVIFTKELESPEIEQKVEFLKNLREQKLSVEEIGLNLLKKNLENSGFDSSFDHESIFGILTEGGADKAFKILLGEQSTLKGFA